MSGSQVIFGGMLKDSMVNKLSASGILYYDYYKREETVIANAYATAQGVIKLILNESKKMLSESEILITGYGRTGKAISKQLKALNANITVSVRNYRDIALLHAEGIKAIFYDEIITVGKTFDFVINTVPSLVINKDIIDSFNDKAFLIEIASAPYGFDVNYIHEKNLTFILASSLPGKAVPISAGRILGRSIEHIIKEENLFI
ncbi:Dipicolinate synthase subunit A [bioreactor metagenome]|uniref:Dipicolinate synthase subunit A n=1 Tax=bioreactor metagenome TaxID=1076179 RepID=A0A645CRL4_9ZZZZ